MKLDQTISIAPPAYSDNNNNIINPEPITLAALNVTYCDNPTSKQFYARIDRIPTQVTLLQGEEYDSVASPNREYGESKLREALGNEPAVFLRGLFPRTMEEDPHGPGTLLSNMIKSVGIVMTQGCSCRRHALEMNKKGNDWCSENVDTIVGWLREEAAKRKLPFIDAIGKLIVNRAVKKSRRLLANQTVPDNDEELDTLQE
jgi:hypothetical protein